MKAMSKNYFISYGIKSRSNYLPHSQNIDKSILKSSFEHTFILQVYQVVDDIYAGCCKVRFLA